MHGRRKSDRRAPSAWRLFAKASTALCGPFAASFRQGGKSVFFRKPDSDVTAVLLTTGEPTTQSALESLRRQTAPVRDLVVVSDVRPFHKALNDGVARVATAFFVQVDADMILDPNCVASLRKAMRPNVGITVGHLRDAMMQQVVGVKLFRTECFAIAQFRDSISPDTDFVDEIARAGWRTVYVGAGRGLLSNSWATFGEHKPDYTSSYTYRKYLMEGRRYRHRGNLGGLVWQLGRLEQSKHPSAFVAQIAFARGFFRETNLDALGRMQGDDEFARLEAFLSAAEAVPVDLHVDLHSAPSRTPDRFRTWFQAGNAAFKANDPATFRHWMQMLKAQPHNSNDWTGKLALCQGLLATALDEKAIQDDYQRLSAFIAAADQRRFLDAPPPVSIPDPDDLLDDVMSYALDVGLRRFVVAPAGGAEYATARPGEGPSYCRTDAEVVIATDAKHRPRIRPPFRLFGNIVCTEPERMAGVFWCFDLLRAGYLFAHVPTSSGPHRVLLPRLFARNVLARGCRLAALLIRWSPNYSTAFAQVAKSRKPRYRPKTGHVLMVTTDLERGGSERQMLATASGLVDRGYRVRILAITRLEPCVPSFETELTRLGIPIEFVSDSVVFNRPSMRSPLGGLRSADCAALPGWFGERIASIATPIERHRPAVVHCWLDGPGIFGALAGCCLGAPRVLIQFGSTAVRAKRSERAELFRQAYQALVRNPAVTIVNNSKAGARDYEEWLGFPPGTIAVRYNGFILNSARTAAPAETTRLRVSLGLPPEAPVVGTVMRFVPEKDPDLWLDTAAEIAKSRPNVRFLVGGFGVLEQDMRRRIEALGLGGRVVLAGPVTDAGLVYSAMDVVLLTSAIEGLPNVMIEAQAVGRPVVAPDVGGTREALSEGRTGVIVRPRSASNLAKAVVGMLDDTAWRERVRTEGPDFVAQHFGLDRMVTETLEHYRFVTER